MHRFHAVVFRFRLKLNATQRQNVDVISSNAENREEDATCRHRAKQSLQLRTSGLAICDDIQMHARRCYHRPPLIAPIETKPVANSAISVDLERPFELCYSNTTVYYGIHECSECIPVDSGVTNLIHDRRSCVDVTLEVEANVARCIHSSMNKPGVKRNSGL